MTNGELGGFDAGHDRINRSVHSMVMYVKGLESLEELKGHGRNFRRSDSVAYRRL
ncbi:MAG: hypothetical protein PVI69_04175 [Desulfobacterales bacterium]